jgi:hypothetical protein
METDMNDKNAMKPEIGYPYLVIRLTATVYQRVAVDVRTGEAEVFIDKQKTCFVQHPEPFGDEETLSEECRALLLNGVLAAVQGTRTRMCVVWCKRSCTFVEIDGSFKDESVAMKRPVSLFTCTFVEIDGSFNDSEETPSGLSHIPNPNLTPN